MFRFIALPLCALVSIAAGGSAVDSGGPTHHRVVAWGSSFWPDAPADLMQPRLHGVERQRPATPHRTARKACRSRSLGEIAQDESGGDYGAQNRRSTASGKYQVLDSTWGGYGGYRHAKDAPPEMQEDQAAELYRLAGATPWNASC